MKTFLLFLLAGMICASSMHAAVRSSASYSLAAESMDNAGRPSSSASYTHSGSAGSIVGLGSVASPNETIKHGYIGQLYEIIALQLALPSANLNETASAQLTAAPLLDDATTLASLDPSSVTWSIVSGPLASISTGGMATAATVYQDTPASVGGVAGALNGQFTLTVLNVGNDDFGLYAGDGIDDSWQVQYFGQNNPNAGPNADPDGDGQNNLFESMAGLIPTDRSSRFTLQIAAGVSATSKTLTFNPIVAGRSYLIQSKPDLTSATWSPVSSTNQSDNGTARSVTDPNASGGKKTYRVQISKP
jgi:hypothetical protein